MPHERLYPAPPPLQGMLAALVSRDTRAANLSDAQRLTHFPASPLVSLSWFHGMEVGLVEQGQDDPAPAWRPFGASMVIAGSQSRPLASWAPTTGRGYMACFAADVAQALFGLELSAIHDRFTPAGQLLDGGWKPMLDDLSAAADDMAVLAALERHLAPRWQALQHGPSVLTPLRQLGRHWVERLALQVRAWQASHSTRQAERRVKAFSGRSLREWQALTRTEGLFFAARERHEAGMPYDWAGLAQEQGFADQAHMSRVARQITGFPPGEFAQRFVEDESFWLYRLWV